MNAAGSESEHEQLHLPVLVSEVVQLLVTDKSGRYLDVTAGAGGHLKAFSGKLGKSAELFGLDKDNEAMARVTARLMGISQGVHLFHGSFGQLESIAAQQGWSDFSGILADLGLSSPQLNTPERGFAFRLSGPLDMRFDQSQGEPVSAMLNDLSEATLAKIFREYGEEQQASRIARAIVRRRQITKIESTDELVEIVNSNSSPRFREKTLARIFQSLRIAVNSELTELEELLPAAVSLLKQGGRLGVISYHSLEDRRVKQFMQKLARPVCSCPPGLPICVCGKKPTLKLITRKPVVPTELELSKNPRARSAKLRVAEKI